MRHTL
jgi:hypothetical protein